eukprot:CAMPEP_0179040140 /NCGR_PEP_ID=MMETSP0796-20121207/15495_1 /TAXON_ID=73915 /ORGANISM="Pyrodinium bahamense, Strain pbaha01" /LENGTH=84 /DNA_ID=CAMNT_0020736479 /DNA_START=66 /DNA_END=317 /DNA_ORIENTATION=-
MTWERERAQKASIARTLCLSVCPVQTGGAHWEAEARKGGLVCMPVQDHAPLRPSVFPKHAMTWRLRPSLYRDRTATGPQVCRSG